MATLIPTDTKLENPKDLSDQAKTTETAQILMAIHEFEQAKYADAEKIFLSLKETKGYNNFSQKGLIKSLWAQNKKEKAEGAFLSSLLQTNVETKREMAEIVV